MPEGLTQLRCLVAKARHPLVVAVTICEWKVGIIPPMLCWGFRRNLIWLKGFTMVAQQR